MNSSSDSIRQQMFELLDPSYLGVLAWKKFFFETQGWAYEKRRDLQLCLLKAVAQEFDLRIDSWDDFHSLKLETKRDLENFTPHNADFATAFQTSGSSGNPFAFYRDKALEAIDAAMFERAWSWVGRTDEPVLRLVTGPPKWKFYDHFRNIVPMDYRTVDDTYVDRVIRMRPLIIHGVGGAVRELTHRLVQRGAHSSLREATAYLMSEDTRSHREALLPYYKAVRMGYGTAECRTVASECGHGTLHVNMETSIAESINGELFVTNLLNKVMPFVRYATGDKGEVVHGKSCECGITSDVIVGLEGKVIDFYYADDIKRPIGRWLVSPITHKYSYLVKAWRVEVVPKKRLVRVYVVPRTASTDKFSEYLTWIEENTGFKTELVTATDLPGSRAKLLKVIDE